MSDQNSVISYVPQPFFVAGSDTVVGHTNVDSVDNGSGLFDPDLSNYAEVNASASAASFTIKIDFSKTSAHLTNANMTIALLGCSLLTYEDDGGSPDLDTEFSEDLICSLSANISAETSEMVSYAHNSQDDISTFGKEALPNIISGGRTNVVFSGMGASNSDSTGTIYVTIDRLAANVSARPHAVLRIGHLFIGVDVEVTINPRTFSWTLNSENERFQARDFGAINSDGTIIKRATGELIKMTNSGLIGSTVTGVSPVVVSQTPNFFDLVKVNTSYALLFNSYPAGAKIEASASALDLNQTARQNFFSIYGFMTDPLELNIGEFRDGLNTEYRARFRIQETG
jgi:hypothetical protein